MKLEIEYNNGIKRIENDVLWLNDNKENIEFFIDDNIHFIAGHSGRVVVDKNKIKKYSIED